jgi:hypothetical protein
VNRIAALVTAAGIGVGLVAAWVWPPLAVVIVWPLLVIVPGWAIVAWAARGGARMASTGRLGLAIVLSVAVSAHLVWWLSTLLGGYGREVVFMAAAVLTSRCRDTTSCVGVGSLST